MVTKAVSLKGTKAILRKKKVNKSDRAVEGMWLKLCVAMKKKTILLTVSAIIQSTKEKIWVICSKGNCKLLRDA